jgi:transposase-like protein
MQAPSEKISAPVDCPSCGSTHVVTAADVKGKAPVKNADRYWRCAACGQVWNPGRARAHQERTGHS